MGHSVSHFDRGLQQPGSSPDEVLSMDAHNLPAPATNSDSLGTLSDETHSQPARIAWIDSFALTRDCIMKVLWDSQPNLTVQPFVSVEAFLARDVEEVDVIILYSHRTYDSCLQDIALIRDSIETIPVIVLSDLEDSYQVNTIRGALRAGASGFIATRSMGLGMTLSAIRFVQSGGTFAPLEILLSDSEAAPQPQPAQDAPYKLTARQRDVLAQLQQGKANKIIAHELGMSESTAKVHIRNIMRKMGATNRTQAAFNALRLYAPGEARSVM
jgi:DNA-binding NarL/FixJ family response regulator